MRCQKSFANWLFEKTRGNPFFVEEVIRSLKEEEVIYRQKNQWKIKEVSRIKFPKTVKSVIKKRVSRLDDESQRVLTMASFVGKDFTFEALQGVAGVEEDGLLEIIEEMFKAGLFKHTVVRGENMCSFADIIVRDVVHEEVNPFKRNKFHGVVGHALEKVYAENIDEHLGELALHFLESGDKDKALDYFLKAGEKASEVYANSEAASYFQSALKLLEEKEGELQERGRVLEKLGDIKDIVGEFDACVKHWNNALQLWNQMHEKEKVARLHRKMARALFQMGDVEKAKESLNKALKILEAEPESIELATVYGGNAGRLWISGDMVEARSWAEKALKIAQKLKDLEGIARSHFLLGTILGSMGNDKKGIEYLEKALKIALDVGATEIALRAYNNLGASLAAERSERRLECLEKGYELAKKAGHISHQSWLGNNLAEMRIYMGNMNEAVLLAEESVVLDRKANNLSHLPLSLHLLGFVYQILGEWDKSEQYYNEAFNTSQTIGDFQSVAYSYWYLGLLHFDKGKYAEAREHFEKAVEICEKAEARSYQMSFSQWVAWTYIELGEVEKAQNLIDNLLKFALEVKSEQRIANGYALRAMLFRAQRKWKKSIEHFEKSLQEHEALDARRWNVYWFAKMVLCEYARMYLERYREGDREKARNLFSEALEIFQKIGAKRDIEKVKSKIICLETGREISEPEPAVEVSQVVFQIMLQQDMRSSTTCCLAGYPRITQSY